MHPDHLRYPINRFRPSNPALDKLLHLRPQLRLGEREIINSPGAQNRKAREASTAAIHKRPACLTEVVGHQRVSANCLSLAERRKVFLAAHMLEVRIGHGDVGLVKGGTDLAAVGAMADVTIN